MPRMVRQFAVAASGQNQHVGVGRFARRLLALPRIAQQGEIPDGTDDLNFVFELGRHLGPHFMRPNQIAKAVIDDHDFEGRAFARSRSRNWIWNF